MHSGDGLSEQFIQHLVDGLASPGLILRRRGRLENPKGFAIIGDLNRLTGTRESFDFERLSHKLSQGNCFHIGRHYRLTPALLSIRGVLRDDHC